MLVLGPKPNGYQGRFYVKRPPVSVQAAAESKRRFKDAMRAITKTAEFLLSGDVELRVEWYISETERYETDRAPDIDNIRKPLIDAVVGPDGLVIDDNQIQHVSCSWMDVARESQELVVELNFVEDEWLPKQGLVFAQLTDALCVPLPGVLNDRQKSELIQVFTRALQVRREAQQLGIDSGLGRLAMPIQRVFHRSRINGFPVLSAAHFDVK